MTRRDATSSPTPLTDKLEFVQGLGKGPVMVVAASEYAKLERELQIQDDANEILTRDLELCRAVTRLCCKKETSVSEKQESEGYPGIAHDLEAFRTALVTIRDECFNGHAYDIAVRALKNAAPQAEPRLEGDSRSGGCVDSTAEIASPAVAATSSTVSAIAPAEAYVLAIQQSVGSILSQYAANLILDRAKEISNGN